MLDRQINLFKVDTNAFLTEEENNHRKKLIKVKKEREELYIRKKVSNRGKTFEDTIKKYKDEDPDKYINDKYTRAFILKTRVISDLEKKWKQYILKSSADAVIYNNNNVNNKHIRELRESYLSYCDINTGEKRVNLKNVIAMFESTLSRSFDIKQNELTYDIFVIEIYYYDIAQDLILNGFNYEGKHYVYFSSSAGQIRTKKAVFVEEEKYLKVQKKLMCGLTTEYINECGGMNINKYLAYLALANSATDLWYDVFGFDFDIDKSIVVDDFETEIECKVDDIDYETYKITPGVKKKIPIPHTDGCGMADSNIYNKNFMVRLPFIKGLLGSFDYKKFITENNCSPIVKDIWGKEYNIIEDDIQVIFTKSQLKMYKYYESWDQYKMYFKKHGCEAGVCNLEEDKIPNAKINYQMLQTLYDMSDDEVADLCCIANRKIEEIADSVSNALDFFGVRLDDEEEIGKDWFQKSLKIYPELLTDQATRQDLKDLRDSYVKKYKSGKLDVFGKFTFVLPDLYAFCEWLFKNIKIPLGLLKNGEVYCRLYPNHEKLDCLRSPHLYIEHAIRKNQYNNEQIKEWFNTDAIYTSTYDPISRILQFDVDGDRLLVLAQPKLVKIAERCSKDVYPLYYEMKKAKAEKIIPQNLYNGLKLAFTGGRIGGISNDITKIWNSEEITDEAKSVVKWLCMETNFTIDYAKTLFKPTRPKEIDDIMRSYTKAKVPNFFMYAKNKSVDQVEDINDSMMNRVSKEINECRNMFGKIKGLEKVNYLYMLKDMQDIYSNEEINNCFDKWNKRYGNNIKIDEEDFDKNNINVITSELKKDLHKIEIDDNKIINSLVSFLYKKNSSRKKKLLWYTYGQELYTNLLSNLSDEKVCWKCGRRVLELNEYHICDKCEKKKQKEIKNTKMKKVACQDCGKVFMVGYYNTKTTRCEECQKEKRKNDINENAKRYYKEHKN